MSVSLAKGQKISLKKTTGTSLRTAVMGLGWDAKRVRGLAGLFGKTQEIDLDASCVMFDGHARLVDTVWFRQLQSRDGAIIHTGDNRTGAGEGDDEQIIVNLSDLPASVCHLVFVVNSFTGQNFSQIENAFCRLVDAASQKEIARFNLSGSGPHTAQIMARLHRSAGDWHMQAIGERCNGQTYQDLIPLILPHLT